MVPGTFRVLYLIVPALMICAAGEGQEPTVEEIMDAQWSQFENLTSLDMTTEEVWINHRGPGYTPEDRETQRTFRFRMDESKWRVDLEIRQPDLDVPEPDRNRPARVRIAVGNSTLIHYYDGERYYRFIPDGEELIVSGENSRPPYPDRPQFLVPYAFAHRYPEDGFVVLKDKNRWEELARYSTVRGTTMVEDLECVIVDIVDRSRHMFGGELTWYRVCFASQMNYYPVRVEAFGGESEEHLRYRKDFSGIERREVEDGYIFFHTKMRADILARGRASPETRDFVVTSLKVNEGVADSVFHTPPSQVRLLKDLDTGEHIFLRRSE